MEAPALDGDEAQVRQTIVQCAQPDGMGKNFERPMPPSPLPDNMPVYGKLVMPSGGSQFSRSSMARKMRTTSSGSSPASVPRPCLAAVLIVRLHANGAYIAQPSCGGHGDRLITHP
jgi:hypothetical protein